MTVKELIEKLQNCNPNATVCIEAYNDCLAHEVQEYAINDGSRQVYIADNLEYIDEAINGERV
jgi:hypothetical protein